MNAAARRYAKAAIEVVAQAAGGDTAAAATAMVALSVDLNRVAARVAEHGLLREFLNNPMRKAWRSQDVAAVLAPLELVPAARNLVALLAKNDRMRMVVDVAAHLEQLVDAHLDRVRVRVRAAVMPAEAQVQRIVEVLRKRLGRPVLVTVDVVPELIAGMTCEVGDLTFDGSLHSQLAQLAERFDAAG